MVDCMTVGFSTPAVWSTSGGQHLNVRDANIMMKVRSIKMLGMMKIESNRLPRFYFFFFVCLSESSPIPDSDV